MRRRRKVDEKVLARFDEAESTCRCLLALNASDSRQLCRLCETGFLTRPLDGLFARTSFWDGLDPALRVCHIARALSEKYSNWTFSHTTAAVMYGLNVGYSHLDKVHVVASSGSRKGDKVVRHRSKRASRLVNGVKLTTPEETVLDCAAIMPFPDALAVADSAISSRLTCERNLRNAAVHRAGYRGIRVGRRVVAHADGRAESGGESIVRGILIELGYLIKDIQTPVPSIEGSKGPLRLDILLQADDGSLVDLEVDGGEKYENPEMNGGSALRAMMRERQREAGITARGYKVMRVTVAQARDREWLKARLAAYGVHPAV